MATDNRPSTLTTVHNYNLRNQGWPTVFVCTTRQDGKKILTTDPVSHTRNMIGVYPSNADIIFYAKTTVADESEGVGAYSPWWLQKYAYGNSQAARGHYIVNAFNRDRQVSSGLTGIYDPKRDSTNNRPISVAFYAGRVWYLMPDGVIYFSQILTDIANVGKCYQDADPTAEDINELVATDGGEITIGDISRGYKLVQVANFLVVFAENGIWSIGGDGDGAAFSATSQDIKKITEIGAIGTGSMVEAEGSIFYWSEGGVYTLTSDQVTGQLNATNITEENILSLYFQIPEIGRKNAQSFYDENSKKIYWLYNDTANYNGVDFRYKYNRLLVLDLVLKAFYTYSFSTSVDYPFISSFIKKQTGTNRFVLENITDSNGDLVLTTTNEAVSSLKTITSQEVTRIKLLCFNKVADSSSYKYGFSEISFDTMVDWKSIDGVGVDVPAYVDTGVMIMDDLISEKEANVIHFFFKKTETEFISEGNAVVLGNPSSCLFRLKWDWSNQPGAGRWSDLQQIYRFRREYFPIPVGPSPFDYGYDVIQVIEQVRGKGRSLSLHFESEAGKDFHLLGWAIPVTTSTGF